MLKDLKNLQLGKVCLYWVMFCSLLISLALSFIWNDFSCFLSTQDSLNSVAKSRIPVSNIVSNKRDLDESALDNTL